MFDAQTRLLLDNDNKIGLLAVMDEDGYPHMAFINTLTALDENTLAWGQFIQGKTKRLLPEKKQAAFLALTLDRQVFRGKVRYGHEENRGALFERFNNKPLFRYNSYFGIEKAHVMSLVGNVKKEKLSTGAIITGALLSRLARTAVRSDGRDIMNTITRSLFSELDGLKFIAYLDADGFPWIVPCIQAAPVGHGQLIFSSTPYGNELASIPTGSRVAVFFTNQSLRSVMVKGTFSAIKRRGCVRSGMVDIEKIYNPMPPASGYIYPQEPLVKVEP